MRFLVAVAMVSALPMAAEQIVYRAQWHLLDAGRATIDMAGLQASLKLITQGVTARLHHVDDRYEATFAPGFCATETKMHAEEGAKRSDSIVAFTAGKAKRTEVDLVTGQKQTSELAVPGCVHDLVGALYKLRQMPMTPGMEATVPLSDGKKFVQARVQAQEAEMIETPAGQFSAMRVEAFVFNGIFFRRKARLFIWFSNDEKRLPVQIRVEMPFYIGDITLKLDALPASQPPATQTADLRR